MTTRAVLLRAHDFGDTSRILRFYTEDRGLLGVMARGVRGRSGKEGSGLATFASGHLVAYVRPRRDLQTFKDFACSRPRSALGAHVLRFAGASAVAELVTAHTGEEDPGSGLFAVLEAALDRIECAPEPHLHAAVLSGLWRTIAASGFTPELEGCVRCGATLARDEIGRFDAGSGGALCAACGERAPGPRLGPIARERIAALLGGKGLPAIERPRAHLALISDFTTYHVASRPLRSFRFLADLLPPDGPP